MKRDAAVKVVKKKGCSFEDPLLNEIELSYVDGIVRDYIEQSDHLMTTSAGSLLAGRT